ELERAGFIDTTPGRGTFVKAVKAPPMSDEERRQRLASIVEVMLTEARALGFEDEQIVEAVREALRRLDGHDVSNDGDGDERTHDGGSGRRDGNGTDRGNDRETPVQS